MLTVKVNAATSATAIPEPLPPCHGRGVHFADSVSAHVFASRMPPHHFPKIWEIEGLWWVAYQNCSDPHVAYPTVDYGPWGWLPPQGFVRCPNASTISHSFIPDESGSCGRCGYSSF